MLTSRIGNPPRNAVPFITLAIVLAIAAFVVHDGLARFVAGALALCALAVAVVRWKRAPDLMGGGPEEFGDPEDYRRHFGDSIVDARTSVDPQVGMRPVDTTHDR
ncbi:MAG: hypothetical protein ABJB93_02430 [Gaiellales bacterium]